MPTFKSSPDPEGAARGPYDDLNRVERNPEPNGDRNPARADERNAAEVRAQERLERVLDRNGREPEREPEHAAAKSVQQKSHSGPDPLIQGLFSKLPEPSAAWPLPARQKWLQTAANIFDLMYTPGEADAGELAIRVERSAAR
jgi:hypothetical protein